MFGNGSARLLLTIVSVFTVVLYWRPSAAGHAARIPTILASCSD